MRSFRFILGGLCGVLTMASARAQGPVLLKEVVSREYAIQVGAVQTPEIQSLVSREIGVFIGSEPAPPYPRVVSREVSLLMADEAPPPPISGIAVSVSPSGSTVTLDWSTYNQWLVRDVKHYAVYSAASPISSVAGLTPDRIVPGGHFTTTFTGLTEWQDHFFAVVAVDGFDYFDPEVNYAAAYVLMPQVLSRECAIFVGGEPGPFPREVVSREFAVVLADDAPPPRITDLSVGVSPTGGEVTLDWSAYNSFAVRDVLRYDIYVENFPITDVTGLVPADSVGGEIFGWTKSGLPEWQDRFFAVVPVDAFGNRDPAVLYSAAYVLMPRVVSREVGLFVGGEPEPPRRELASREWSVLVADETAPAPVTGIDSGFVADTAAVRYAAIDLDWRAYNEWQQRDVVRYRVYLAETFFSDVTGMLPRELVANGAQTFTLTGLVGGNIYYVAVVAEDASGNFSPTVYSVSVKASPAKLGDVANVTTWPSATMIGYVWELGGVGSELERFLDHFRVYFAGSPVPQVIGRDLRSWTANGLNPGHTYAARFTTVDIWGIESDGITVFATTLAEPLPLAYWRFEEGVADAPVADSAQNTLPVDPVIDSSGNGNPLRTWDAASAPVYRSGVAAPRVPHSGASNNLCLGLLPNDDLYEFQRPIHAHPLNAFTIEASVAPNALDRRQTILGRDGNAAGSTPSIRLLLREDNRFMIELVDATGAIQQVPSLDAAVAGQWYHLIATYDGSSLALYLRGPSDADAALQGAVATQGGVLDVMGTWTVGRGWWNGSADWVDGRIDEVRIIPEAIPRTHFLQADLPWEQWRKSHFTMTELANPSISGELADPDRDGLANLAEYGLGLPPRIPDHGAFSILRDPNSGLSLNYTRNTAAGDVLLSFEVSESLTPGTWHAVTPLVDWMLSFDGFRQSRRASMPSGPEPKLFYRLKITRVAP